VQGLGSLGHVETAAGDLGEIAQLLELHVNKFICAM
jgi:hypothetical protein